MFFPPLCYGCGNEDETLCADCLKRCTKAIDTPALYITSIYSFKDPIIKRAIHAIKYYHRRDLIEPLTRELAKIIQSEIYEEQKSDSAITCKLSPATCVLVPIPMPKLRKYMRGYNQAELIAQELSGKTGLIYKNNLIARARTPKRQVKTSTRGERLNNQKNSFQITGDVSGLNIILVDDVTTTGATIHEARKILLKSGANSVKAVTIAH